MSDIRARGRRGRQRDAEEGELVAEVRPVRGRRGCRCSTTTRSGTPGAARGRAGTTNGARRRGARKARSVARASAALTARASPGRRPGRRAGGPARAKATSAPTSEHAHAPRPAATSRVARSLFAQRRRAACAPCATPGRAPASSAASDATGPRPAAGSPATDRCGSVQPNERRLMTNTSTSASSDAHRHRQQSGGQRPSARSAR